MAGVGPLLPPFAHPSKNMHCEYFLRKNVVHQPTRPTFTVWKAVNENDSVFKRISIPNDARNASCPTSDSSVT